MLLSDHILFLDGEALVVDKPEGLPVDPPRDGSLSLENHLDSLRFGFKRWPLAVHRLDRDTSGCLLLARNPKAHGRFTRAFEERAVEKQYLAILDGVPSGDGGTIDLPLGKTSTAETGWRMVVDPQGKPSVSHWEKLAVENGRALLRFRPETGRTHQIRVHCAHVGNPIAGDEKYGDRKFDKRIRDQSGLKRLFLHAARFAFDLGDRHFEFNAPLPDDLDKVLKRLAKAAPPDR